MNNTNKPKHPYIPPLAIQTAHVLLERDFLWGSIVDNVPFVEISGQEKGGFYESDFSDAMSTFNHTWGGEN